MYRALIFCHWIKICFSYRCLTRLLQHGALGELLDVVQIVRMVVYNEINVLFLRLQNFNGLDNLNVVDQR